VALYFVGSVVLLALAGCGRSWLSFEEREPWRREAEIACLRSGAVKQSTLITAARPIEGPGICGAEHPLKVAGLGEGAALGYADAPRPPGGIPRGFPIAEPRPLAPAPVRYADPPPTARYGEPANSGPLSIRPPGTEPEDENEDPDEPAAGPYSPPPSARSPYDLPRTGASQPHNRAPYPQSAEPPRLGPSAYAAGPAAITPAATLACPVVSALDQWVSGAVQPAAQRWFGQPVAEIKQISAYSCRGMNGQRGAKISEHAFGNALDIAAFVLADGRKITVKDGWRGEPEEQGFLRDVQGAACQQFSTVLAPGSNMFHYDHIHVDLARRSSGRVVCNPRAVPGDLVASRARSGRLGFAAEEAPKRGLSVQLPRAVPGED
jgi:hypothetical protein